MFIRLTTQTAQAATCPAILPNTNIDPYCCDTNSLVCSSSAYPHGMPERLIME